MESSAHPKLLNRPLVSFPIYVLKIFRYCSLIGGHLYRVVHNYLNGIFEFQCSKINTMKIKSSMALQESFC